MKANKKTSDPEVKFKYLPLAKIFSQQLLAYSIILPLTSLALSAAPKTLDDILYLTIVATETEALNATTKQHVLSKQFKNLDIISSNDCTNLKPGLVLYVSNKTNNKSESEHALNNAKSILPDSYLRKCEVKENSLLTMGYSFIHSSLFTLPADTISWSFDDMKSEIIIFNKNASFLIERKYNGNINDEVEGRQAVIYYINPTSNKRQKIIGHCWGFEATDLQKQTILFQCMTGMAANHYIHTIYAYNLKQNKIVYKNEYCQQAHIKSDQHITCLVESVNEFGELKLSPGEFDIN